MIELQSSIPTISQYEELLSSELFHTMEEYSNNFLLTNQIILHEYAAKWVKDPFHQWSRQWEYVYVYSRIVEHISGRSEVLNILDAGSGITFFPYFLKSKHDPINISCCDVDPELKETYDAINKSQDQSVKFLNLDLANISSEDESLDIVYCISVIEHTKDFSKIIDEFYRIIKPGGKLIVTFDISLDGAAQLSPEKSEFLLDCIYSKFTGTARPADLASLLSKSDIVTTNYAYKLNPNLIPMNKLSLLKSRVKSLIKMEPIKKYPYPLSFYCLDVSKK
ncbi:MAG: class I SAM-dependent methyltransferase [Bellilinea sp.]